MDFAKFIILAVFLNIMLVSSLNVIGTQSENSYNQLEDNLLFQNTNNNKDNTISDNEEGGLGSTLYEATFGNAIQWGRNLWGVISSVMFDSNEFKNTQYEQMKAVNPITAYFFMIVVTFQVMFNIYASFKVYGYFKNKVG